MSPAATDGADEDVGVATVRIEEGVPVTSVGEADPGLPGSSASRRESKTPPCQAASPTSPAPAAPPAALNTSRREIPDRVEREGCRDGGRGGDGGVRLDIEKIPRGTPC